MNNPRNYPVAERSERPTGIPAFGTHHVPRAQFAKPILVDDSEHFPIHEDWSLDFLYQDQGGEG